MFSFLETGSPWLSWNLLCRTGGLELTEIIRPLGPKCWLVLLSQGLTKQPRLAWIV